MNFMETISKESGQQVVPFPPIHNLEQCMNDLRLGMASKKAEINYIISHPKGKDKEAKN